MSKHAQHPHPIKPATADCVHTVRHGDETGRLLGTWQKFSDATGDYIACRVCGRWYGRVAGK